ncbi:MAG: hypothetical protein AAGA29_07355 [Planctomycetota bacterium]
MAKQRRKWLGITLLFVAITVACSWLIASHLSRPMQFESLDDFSVAWKHTPEQDRHELLTWLLGQPPSRHTTYPAHQTKLSGLQQAQVEKLLGVDPSPITRNGVTVNYYDVGSIESDTIGFFLPGIAKWDSLEIQYDQDGNILKISTIS